MSKPSNGRPAGKSTSTPTSNSTGRSRANASKTSDFKTYSGKIYSFFNKNSRMPSYAEICILCDLKSKNTAHNLIKKLQALKYIDTDKTGKIIPIQKRASFPTAVSDGGIKSMSKNRPTETAPLMLLGLVEAGFPTPSEESLHENISLDDWIIDKKEASFMLKVKGESMRDAGILDGDMVIVERSNMPKIGQIVVAEVDGAYTMKYFKKDRSGRAYLEAANPDFDPIYPKNDMQITAVVKAVVRKYGK